ncbi:MAG TPA: hypothetical protein ENJ09_11190 [Planctomycetes bacterium]|nr:hypothetical protein [Planctomycetota bacterium]
MQRLARFATLILIFAGLSLASAQDGGGATRFVRVTSDGAKVMNLADEKGVVVATPARGTLLRVDDATAKAGWIQCEEPGGFAVWVFGKYLTKTDQEGVLEVTRNAINIRPGPSSTMENFPLPQRLHAGDRVSFIEVLDPEVPMAETWVRVWSPPGVRAWIRESETEPLGAGEDGDALWTAGLEAAAARVAPKYVKERKASQAAPEAKPGVSDEGVSEELARARAELEAEARKDTPDFGRVRGLVEAVLRKEPDGRTAIEASETLHRIEALEEAARLRQDLLAERERRARRAAEKQEELWRKAKHKDPLGGVFRARGALFRRQATDGSSRYFLRFGGETVAELLCSSERYDLSRFVGLEVGVQGDEAGGDSEAGGPPRIDVSRLEILKLR